MSTLVKTRGIVLNHHLYRESSAVVRVYTRELGMQAYMVNGIRGTRKNRKTPLLQPLNRLWMEVYHSPKKELHRIKEFGVEQPLRHIPYSQGTRAQAFFITEVLTRVLILQEPAPGAYDFLDNAINLLDAPNPGNENLHLYILFKLTRLLGFQPVDNHSPACSWFDLKNGCFTATQPKHPLYLVPGTASLFARFFKVGAHSINELARNVNERQLLLEALIDFYRLHTQGLGEIKSLEVLQHTLHLNPGK